MSLALYLLASLLFAEATSSSHSAGAPTCDTVPACIARTRAIADPGGITDAENEVAKRLQALSPQSISPVIALLEDRDPNVRELAGYVLRGMSGLEPRHLPPLQRAVERGDGWLPPAIASIGTPDAIRFLVGELRKKPETSTQLTYAFEKLGRAAFPDLIELFRCTQCDPNLLRVVGHIFSEVRESAADVVTPLVSIAGDGDAPLVARRGALQALAGLGPTGRPAVPALLGLTRQQPAEIQTAARQALLGIGGAGTKEILESLLDAAEKAEEKALVLRDIAWLGTAGQEAGARVEQLLSSASRDVRVLAARTLGFIEYAPAAPSLARALEEPDDWRLVYAAAEALGRFRATDTRDALTATASSHWYPPVRERARDALRALDGKHRYGRSPYASNFALEFFENEPADERHGPCGDRNRFPPAPATAVMLDPASQPALADSLAYEREIRGLDEKGWHIERHRTIPELGMRVGAGWLVGVDQGEWGGELVLKPDGGGTKMVLEQNISAVHMLDDGRIVAVAGLAHLSMDNGDLYRIECSSNECHAAWWKTLPGAPRSSWVTMDGELLVNTTKGTVLVTPDGTMQMADCGSSREDAAPQRQRR